MISNEAKELLKNLKNTPYGRALQEYLDDEYDRINDVQACNSWEEVLGRKHTLATIEKLFSFMAMAKTEARQKNQYF
jgi:hypothetical protein